MNTDHERWREELAAYLLGALEPGEAADLERHLAGCEECRTELSWLRPAMRVLPEGVAPSEPSPGLRERVMAEVRSDIGSTPGVERPPALHLRRFPDFGRRAGGEKGHPGLRPVAALAAVALLIAVAAGYAIHTGSAGDGLSTTITGRAPGITAEVVRNGNSGTLHLAGLRQVPSGKILQAWVRRGSRVISANSLFAPDRDGSATAAIPDMQGVSAVMVTVEPQGGSVQPTSTPIINVAVPQ